MENTFKNNSPLEDSLAYIFNKKAVLLLDRLFWLSTIEEYYKMFKQSADPIIKQFCKDQMKFCGEQSQELKTKITTIK